MKAEIMNQKDNPFLQRKELQVAVQHEKEPTPSRAALQEILARQLSEQKEKIDVIGIYSDRGRPRSLSKVFVWEQPPKKVEKKKEAKAEEKKEAKQEK